MYDLDQFARVCEDLGLHGAASLVTLWGLAEEETLPYNAKVFLREAYAGMVDLVNLLYQTGATCSAEMRRLMTRPQIGVYDIVGDADSEVLAGVHRYLEDVVSRPRRLLDLCRLELSRIIGCRADRKERALSLGLPLELTRVVLFYDVLDTCTVL
nr:hypothetical protein BaRGS_016215 [Batillaria attramentaria]